MHNQGKGNISEKWKLVLFDLIILGERSLNNWLKDSQSNSMESGEEQPLQSPPNLHAGKAHSLQDLQWSGH